MASAAAALPFSPEALPQPEPTTQSPSNMEVDAPGSLPDYGLPSLPSLPCPDYRGPTPWCNWVIKGRVIAGAYPASVDDEETERLLSTLLELGINTFVCLQAEVSLHTPESAWRAGQGLRPYIKDAQRVLIRARETHSKRIKQDKLDFLHLPILDGNVTSDSALSRLADDCCMRVLRGERMYIHCWGGHGRTGTLVAVMLARLYHLSCNAALRYTQAFHDSRKYPQGVRSPQTNVQMAQVRRLLPDPAYLRGVVYPMPTIPLTDEILGRPPTAPSGMAPSTPTRDAQGNVSQQNINQQRVEAVRARASAAANLSAQLAAARLGPLAPLAASPAVASPPAPPALDGGASDGALPQPAAAIAAQRQAGYMQQFKQQRQIPDPSLAPPPLSKLAAAVGSGGRPVFNISANSGSAAAAGAGRGQDTVDVSDAFRPSRVVVGIPAHPPATVRPSTTAGTAGTAPQQPHPQQQVERSPSSFSKLVSYLHGQQSPSGSGMYAKAARA